VRASFVRLCGSHLSISVEVIRQSVRRSFFRHHEKGQKVRKSDCQKVRFCVVRVYNIIYIYNK